MAIADGNSSSSDALSDGRASKSESAESVKNSTQDCESPQELLQPVKEDSTVSARQSAELEDLSDSSVKSIMKSNESDDNNSNNNNNSNKSLNGAHRHHLKPNSNQLQNVISKPKLITHSHKSSGISVSNSTTVSGRGLSHEDFEFVPALKSGEVQILYRSPEGVGSCSWLYDVELVFNDWSF